MAQGAFIARHAGRARGGDMVVRLCRHIDIATVVTDSTIPSRNRPSCPSMVHSRRSKGCITLMANIALSCSRNMRRRLGQGILRNIGSIVASRAISSSQRTSGTRMVHRCR